MAKDGGDRRRYQRVRVAAHARLFSDAQAFPCELIDISVKGALLTRPPKWQGGDGDRCLLEIAMEGEPPVEMEVNVVRVENGEIACDWDMFDVRGILQLRRMLEQEMGDADQVARDLAAVHMQTGPGSSSS